MFVRSIDFSGHLLLRIIEPRTFKWYKPTESYYVDVATFGADRPRISVWYDWSLDENINRPTFWVGFGKEDPQSVVGLLEECAPEFPTVMEFPLNAWDHQLGRLGDEALKAVLTHPIKEFDELLKINGFGVYGEPGVDTLELPRALDFIEQVLYCLPEYRVAEDADARKTSIWMMANQAEQTARNSNGQTVVRTVTVRDREVRMTRQEHEEYVNQLLIKQENKCALTGISLQFYGAHIDNNLLPSLDRIDSEGHYEKGNEQVVCRFINFWKSATPNDEFKRLLRLVRDAATT
jgi:hypothetical protein